MDSAKALFGAVAGRFLFRHGILSSVASLSEHFVRLEVSGAELEGADFTPGDKVQVFLRGRGMRTYTPVTWSGGRTWFVGFVHGEGPGAQWLRGAKAGDAIAMMGPQRSLDASALPGPLVVVGDETSLAVAAALTRAKVERQVTVLLEASAPDETASVARQLELHQLSAFQKGELEPLARALQAQLELGATPIFTGRAATIQALKQRGLKGGKTKAYWADGKRGLD